MDGYAFLKDDRYQKVNLCSIHMRGSKDSGISIRKNRFLMGNTFLKNYYSVYDFDQQAVRLGVNVHSKDWARAYKYKPEVWA